MFFISTSSSSLLILLTPLSLTHFRFLRNLYCLHLSIFPLSPKPLYIVTPVFSASSSSFVPFLYSLDSASSLLYHHIQNFFFLFLLFIFPLSPHYYIGSFRFSPLYLLPLSFSIPGTSLSLNSFTSPSQRIPSSPLHPPTSPIVF